jgi:hypothetical protein
MPVNEAEFDEAYDIITQECEEDLRLISIEMLKTTKLPDKNEFSFMVECLDSTAETYFEIEAQNMLVNLGTGLGLKYYHAYFNLEAVMYFLR